MAKTVEAVRRRLRIHKNLEPKSVFAAIELKHALKAPPGSFSATTFKAAAVAGGEDARTAEITARVTKIVADRAHRPKEFVADRMDWPLIDIGIAAGQVSVLAKNLTFLAVVTYGGKKAVKADDINVKVTTVAKLSAMTVEAAAP